MTEVKKKRSYTRDPMKAAATKKAASRHMWLKNITKQHGLNWNKILCLKWQENTGKKCTNRKHQADEYAWKLECEAQLVESLAMNVTLGMADEAAWRDYKQSIEDWLDQAVSEKVQKIGAVAVKGLMLS